MKFYPLIAVFLLSVIQAGCSTFALQQGESATAKEPILAELTDYELKAGFITFTVKSYGCTFINSFVIEKVPNRENSIQIMRIKPDNCKMEPRPVSLQYSYKHLGVDMNADVQVVHRPAQSLLVSSL